MTGARMNLGFDDLDVTAPEADALPALDTSGFAPKKRPRIDAPALEGAKKAAEGLGFRSREPKGRAQEPTLLAGERPRPQKGAAKAKPVPKALPIAAPAADLPPVRRRRTGRNVQFNIKARPETIAAFTAIADANGWGFGETLEHAVAMLEQQTKT